MKQRRLTDFQRQVLTVTLRIPFGQTRTYQWVAQEMGNPKAVRSVGQALRHNPYPILVPCHRVVKSNGEPGGYAGGPADKKIALLKKEREVLEALGGV